MSRASRLLEDIDPKESVMDTFGSDMAAAFNKLLDYVKDKDAIAALDKIRRGVVADVEDTLMEHGFDYNRSK